MSARRWSDDISAVALAASVAAGAWWPVGSGSGRAVVLGLALATFAVARSANPVLLCVGAALLASGLSARAWAGLAAPPNERVAGAGATLVTDPEPVPGGVRALARVGHRRVELDVRGPPATGFRRALAGERWTVDGELGALPESARRFLAARHVAARVVVTSAVPAGAGSSMSQIANALRRRLERGARGLPSDERALFTGFVLGDDRGQDPAVADDFTGSGLSHLLVVSGENVAFALIAAGPILRRMPGRARLAAGLAVLGLFGVLTRFEPSVCRATAMAALALVASWAGRPVGALRLLAVAVTGLVLVDPLLVHALGFVLSVAASAGIVVLARPLGRALPGPHWLAEAMGATLAAQAGVAPVLAATFGPVPLASLPANLLAVPAAAPVMVWGMTAGVAAGFVPRTAAAVLHLPTRLAIGWIALVARVAARSGLGTVSVTALVAVVGLVLASGRWPAGGRRRTALAAAATVLAAPLAAAAVGAHSSPPASAGDEVAKGIQVWSEGGDVVVVLTNPDPGSALAGLRRAAVERAGLVVVRSSSAAAARSARTILSRLPAGAVLAPPSSGLVASGDASPVVGPAVIGVGALVVSVAESVPPLKVTVASAGTPAVTAPAAVAHTARGPPPRPVGCRGCSSTSAPRGST